MKIAIIIFAVITIFALWYLIVSIGSYFEAKENRIKRHYLAYVFKVDDIFCKGGCLWFIIIFFESSLLLADVVI